MLLLNEYLRSRFGCKVYKMSLSADVTCPNRDGRLDTTHSGADGGSKSQGQRQEPGR